MSRLRDLIKAVADAHYAKTAALVAVEELEAAKDNAIEALEEGREELRRSVQALKAAESTLLEYERNAGGRG